MLGDTSQQWASGTERHARGPAPAATSRLCGRYLLPTLRGQPSAKPRRLLWCIQTPARHPDHPARPIWHAGFWPTMCRLASVLRPKP
eukprot:4570719-Amphidinium_carterae.1